MQQVNLLCLKPSSKIMSQPQSTQYCFRVLMHLTSVQPPYTLMVQQVLLDLMLMHGEDCAPRSILPQMIYVTP